MDLLTFLVLEYHILSYNATQLTINEPVNEKPFIELLSLMEQRDGAYVEVIADTGHFKWSNENEKKPVIGIEGVIYRSKASDCRNSLQAAI